MHDHWVLNFLNTHVFKNWLGNNAIRQLYATGKYPKLFNLPKNFLHKIINQTVRMDSRAADQMGEDLIIHDFSNEARLIKNKALVMSADGDEAVPPRWSEKLAKELLQNGEFVLIKDADHAVVVTEPEKLISPVRSFIFSK